MSKDPVTPQDYTDPANWPPNFRLSEFEVSGAHREPVPAELHGSVLTLAWELQALREHLVAPVRVLSGYRSPEYNASISGAKRSQHMQGRAADIAVKDHSPAQVADAIEALIAAGRMQDGGLGRYPGFTHYDVRGSRARWGSN